MQVRRRTLKVNLEVLLEAMLDHEVPIQKVEKILVDIGVPTHYIERALANILTLSPISGGKQAAPKGASPPALDVLEQLRAIREMMEKVYSTLSSNQDGSSGPART